MHAHNIAQHFIDICVSVATLHNYPNCFDCRSIRL